MAYLLIEFELDQRQIIEADERDHILMEARGAFVVISQGHVRMHAPVAFRLILSNYKWVAADRYR